MRDKFPGYYRPTDDEFAALWKDALFVFDANVLLNLYRINSQAAKEFLGLLESVRDRIWLPYQAAVEYHENRLGVLRDRGKLVRDFDKALGDVRNQLDNAARRLKRHPALDHESMLKKADVLFTEIDQYVATCRSDDPDLFADDVTGADPLLAAVTALFDGRVGDPFPPDELASLYAEGRKRYEALVPPGFEDVDKGEPRQFGDFLLWKETLAKANGDGRPVILVTDDDKDDWWWKFEGKRIGPRPELVKEFEDSVGERFYMYSSERFAEEARRHLGGTVSEETVEEIGRAHRRNRESSWDGTVRGPIAARIAGITFRHLLRWSSAGLVRAAVVDEASGQRRYDYLNLVELTVAKQLIDSGRSLQQTRLAVEALAQADYLADKVLAVTSAMARVDFPTNLRDLFEGEEVVLVLDLDTVLADVDAALAAALGDDA